MTAPTVSRQQAYAAARAVLDRASIRIAADYAAGRLPPAHAEWYERLLQQQRPDSRRAA